jgi:hypothetical protein
MKSKLILSVLLIVVISKCFSQEYIAMYKDKGAWGFINLKGEVIIKPTFIYCRDFNSGIAKVGEKAFINLRGEKIKMKISFLDAHQYNDGMLAVKVGVNWGFVDTSGELVIQAKYKEVTDFYDGYALVSDNNGTFVLDKNGKETKVNSKGDIKSIYHFSEGLAIIETEGNFGFVNTEGTITIEPKFLTVGYFSNGLAWARAKDNKIGFINTKGEWEIKPVFFAARPFDEKSGRARIKDASGWGYVNKKGEILKIKEAEVFDDFEDGLCALRVNNLWGYIDGDGKWVIEPKFEAITPFENGFARIRKKGKWGVINQKGEWILQPFYDNIKPFSKID